LCEQYLAPIIKNRQYNFPPIGLNPFVGASARPNEITYSEDRLNPHLPPAGPDAARSADPGQGLQGLMMPPAPTPAPAEGVP
jgi:phospholipid/cholesterol/gamma-HCH transport system substrate-binding protein